MGPSRGTPRQEAGYGSAHLVTLTRGYWIMEHEVTEGQWLALMPALPREQTPSDSELPVAGVRWDEAVEFARRASDHEGVVYRLPTEAEWERAAWGGEELRYAGSADADLVAWTEENSGGTSHPVCLKRRNGYGLCDMSGNVLEWTSDWYDWLGLAPATDPIGLPNGSARVARGGSWMYPSFLAQTGYRAPLSAPSGAYSSVGFRLARSAP